MSAPVRRILLDRWEGSNVSRRPDEVLVEEPLRVRVDGVDVTTTMRTPGADFELAVGLALAEGLLTGTEVVGIGYPRETSESDPLDGAVRAELFDGSRTVTTVEVRTTRRRRAARPRLAMTTAACGLCGHDAIELLLDRLTPFTRPSPLDQRLLAGVVECGLADQPWFARTGVAHGAAVVDLGRVDGASEPRVLAAREDIGRHNAVDKAVGSLILEGHFDVSRPVQRSSWVLVVSGRASFEMVQKAWSAGIPALVSVSGPSSLAVETARRAGVTLVGFARDGTGNRYSP